MATYISSDDIKLVIYISSDDIKLKYSEYKYRIRHFHVFSIYFKYFVICSTLSMEKAYLDENRHLKWTLF